MCFQEFIAYQCGHRSLSVVRPCPMTTASHNFPICSIRPHKPYYTETMCAPCERQLHSRWVLIREWEHRWLHERGACGCEVVFPGLLDTPRVIGDTSGADHSAKSISPAASPAGGEGGKNDAGEAAAARGSGDVVMPRVATSDEETTSFGGDGGRVPAIFSQSVASTGERRVAVRLPGLFAGEWKADHAILHKAGKCPCAAAFDPFTPQISDEELTTADREILQRWRQREAQGETSRASGTSQVASQVGEVEHRIAEIKKIFGEFDIRKNKQPSGNAPRRPPIDNRESQPARNFKGQGCQHQRHHHQQYANNNNDNANGFIARRFHNRLEQSQPTQPFTPAKQPHSQLVAHPSRASGSPAHPSTPAHPGGSYYPPLPPTPPATAPRARSGMGHARPGHSRPGCTPHTHRHPRRPRNAPPVPAPAHPAYATAATYSDAIPAGASPWLARPRRTAGMPWPTVQGPGPYRTPGLIYEGASSGKGSSDNTNTATAAADMTTGAVDQGRGKGKAKATDATPTNSDPDPDLPLCGLPIGAGPEGAASHDWPDP
ncbi:hypothetical protein VTH06DRAFT_8167 [Thermothelomyces fergusii]